MRKQVAKIKTFMKKTMLYNDVLMYISFIKCPVLVLGGILLHVTVLSVPMQAALPVSSMHSMLASKIKQTDTGKKLTKKTKSSGDDFDDFSEFEEETSKVMFLFNGFIELENFINIYSKQDPEDVNKKNEIRLKLSMQIGTDRYYFKCVPNLYFLPFFFSNGLYDDYHYVDKDFNLSRNGRISGKYYEMSFNECFVNIGLDKGRIRIGNQIYAWGTADLFNPTSYINPADSRELFLKDPDEMKLGVPSVSAMVFLKNYSLEFVFVPIHVGALSAISENFWAYHYEQGFLSLIEDRYKALDPAAENLGFGVRWAGTVTGVDFSLSAYYGPDNNPILRPISYVTATSDILVRQEYHTAFNMGFDLSFRIGDYIEIHGEIAFSPNKYGVVDEIPEHYTQSDVAELLKQPFSIKRSHWWSYTLGFNFVYKDFLLASEWYQSAYMNQALMAAYLTDILVVHASYTFHEDMFTIGMVVLYDAANTGYVLGPAMDFDFHNGFSMKIGYSYISKIDDDDPNVFTLFNKNDILILEGRYAF